MLQFVYVVQYSAMVYKKNDKIKNVKLNICIFE